MKEVEFGQVEATELRVKPHLPVLGPKLGKELAAVRDALAAGEFEQLEGGRFRVAATSSIRTRCSSSAPARRAGRSPSDEGVTVALDMTLDEELEREGRVYDLIHTVNSMRKEPGLELTDRIAVTLPPATRTWSHADWIKAETLAVSLEIDGVEAPQIAKVDADMPIMDARPRRLVACDEEDPGVGRDAGARCRGRWCRRSRRQAALPP